MATELQPEFSAAGLARSTVHRFKMTVALGSAGAAIVAVAGLLGHVPGWRVLGSIRPEYSPMAPSTAGCLLILALALYGHDRKPWQGARPSTMEALALFVTVFGLLAVVGHFAGTDLTFEARLTRGSGALGQIPIGRMSPVSGVSAALAGLGTWLLLLRSRRSRPTQRPGYGASSLGVLTMLAATTVLLAYLHGTPRMYSGTTVPMAPTSAVAFLFLGAALVASSGPTSFPIRLVVGDLTSARLLRAFLPVSLGAFLLASHLAPLYSLWVAITGTLLRMLLTIVVGVMTAFVATQVAHRIGKNFDDVNRKLQESELRSRAITQSAHDAIVTADSEGNIVGWNPGAETMFGFSESEALGSPFALLLRGQTEGGFAAAMSRITSGEEPGTVDKAVPLTGVRKGDIPFPLEISVAMWKSGEDPYFTGIIRDTTERTQAALALGDALSEARRLRDALDQVPSYIFMKDREYRYLYANEPTLKLFHCSAEQLVGCDDSRFFPPEMVARLRENDSRVMRGEQSTDEIDETNAAGERRIYLEVKSPIRAEPESMTVLGLLGISTDITARKLAEEALRESEERHRLLADNAADVIWTMNLEGRFTYVSPSVERLRGYTSAEVMQHSFEHSVCATSLPVAQEALARVITAMSAGLPVPEFRGELELPRKDGTTVWTDVAANSMLDAAGHFIGVLGVARDISERKQSEEQVRRMALMVDTAPNAITVHGFDGRFLYANRRTLELHGYSQDEFMTLNLAQLDVPADAVLIAARMQELRERGEASFEAAHFRKDGTILPLHVSLKITTWGGNDVILSVATDITASQRAEEERRALQAQLTRAQKMESIGLLAGGVAHDFNNMLAVILGSADLAMLKLGKGHAVSSHIEALQTAAQRSSDLTRQLLAFARQQPITPKVLDLNETVDGILKMLRRLLGEHVKLVWTPGRALWKVIADPTQIDQVLANLSVNARDAMTERNALLEVATANVVLDAAFVASHPGTQAGEFVHLSVRDTGSGMDAHTLSRIFEPYFTTKAPGEGTGLGLSTVIGIVMQHGGFVDVESTVGVGTTFHLYFPRTSKSAEHIAVQEKPLHHGTETILLTEDEEGVRRATTEMLRMLGYTVLSAQDGNEAVTLAASHPEPLHLLLTDVIMPGMSGAQMRDRLRTLHPSLKVLFMSGYLSSVIATEGVLEPHTHFLQKPFTLQALADAVRNALDG